MEEKTRSDKPIQRKKSRDSRVTNQEAEAAVPKAAEESAGQDEKAVISAELSEEEKLQARVDDLEDKLLRTMADFDNYKKRVANQYEELIRSANDRLIGEVLEVVDNLERALQHSNDETDQETVRQGTEMIFNQMRDLLERYDVKAIDAIGKPFDPHYHEALMQIESEEYDKGIVALEIKKGYTIGRRVIRHSKVGVSSGKGHREETTEGKGEQT